MKKILVASIAAAALCGAPAFAADTPVKEPVYKAAPAPLLNWTGFYIGGIAKGAGMINPNMATMLCVITTDASFPQPALRVALRAAVENSFNRITIDGDMSTNDTVILLANGASGVSPSLPKFQEALDLISKGLARMIVKDGEGVTKFIEVEVRGAASAGDARRAAQAVANSTLVKCAWAGGDPNWGRIVDALGYSGARVVEEKIDI
jgi:glutamate N-acetyltransferase/amino-acid N-acetyltransferase